MKIKHATRYHLQGFVKASTIYYTIVIAFQLLALLIIHLTGSNDSNISGLEISSSIFLFVMGLNAFKSQFTLFLQNGISRKTLFCSALATFLMVSFAFALIDAVYPLLFSSRFGHQSLYAGIYLRRQISFSLMGILWAALLNLIALCGGFLISTLYYRLNRLSKTLVSITVPLLLFVVIPIVEALIPTFHFYSTLFQCISWCLGFESGTLGFQINQIRPLLCFAAFSALLSGLSFLLIRRATLREAQ